MLQQNDVISIAHKVEILPDQEAILHFRRAFGCARFAYNWGLTKWQEYYQQGIKKTHFDLKKEFNSLKKEHFPYVYEVSKYATQQPFIHLKRAFDKFFRDLKSGKVSYPKFKKRKENCGSYYIGSDHIDIKEQKYLKIPKLGMVKMREPLRFNGKINSCTISQHGNKFFASFSLEISKEEYIKHYKQSRITGLGLGIDLGISNFLSLSNGLMINAPKPLPKHARKLIRAQRQLSKKQHARTKQEALKGVKKSNNYIKASLKVNKIYRKISNIRNDFLHKLTSCLVRNVDYFCLENLHVQGMMRNRKLAKSLSDVSFYEFRRLLEYKASNNNKQVYIVDRFFPSSKTCSNCGHIKSDLTLKDRVYTCDNCSSTIHRDYNASLNLLSELKKQVGKVLAEFTSVDLEALQLDLAINQIATNKIEAEI